MSNGIRFDSLLVRDVAEELDGLLAGRILRAVLFDRETRRVLLRTDDFLLCWDLHPQRGGLLRLATQRMRGNVPVAHPSTILAVLALPDERIIEIALQPENATLRDARAIIVELVPNRWSAFALGARRRVTAVLRVADSPTRALAPGAVYVSPRPTLRLGGRAPLELDDWLRLLLPTPPGDRRRRVLDAVAHTSAINIEHILGDAASEPSADALRAAFMRYREVVRPDARAPCLLAMQHEAQPYPVTLGTTARRFADLLSAFDAAQSGRDEPPLPAASGAALIREAHDAVQVRLARLDRRIQRMRQELDHAPADATSHRRLADLLLAQIHAIPRGAEFADLDDLAGGLVRVRLDPALGAAENAARFYETARKRERAARRLPSLIARSEQQRDFLLDLAVRIVNGQAEDPELREAAGLKPAGRARGDGDVRLPYRRYRTSSGHEVRVGRSAAANDELTFHHARPDDIWMHARDVAGAHVVLRWADRENNPPAADLTEAAVLAALHSRARTSGAVPVDWTRRKYVRKPRKSKPGSVVVERARTIFVEPEAAVERRLRVEE